MLDVERKQRCVSMSDPIDKLLDAAESGKSIIQK